MRDVVDAPIEAAATVGPPLAAAVVIVVVCVLVWRAMRGER